MGTTSLPDAKSAFPLKVESWWNIGQEPRLICEIALGADQLVVLHHPVVVPVVTGKGHSGPPVGVVGDQGGVLQANAGFQRGEQCAGAAVQHERARRSGNDHVLVTAAEISRHATPHNLAAHGRVP